jgi:Outer membrane protein Omp28
MKNIKHLMSALALIAVFFISCDKIEEPFAEESGLVDSDRKVLLEEYTGHKCPNCPQGSKIAQDLKSTYGDRLIVVSMHVGWYASPDATGSYTADFRTEIGEQLETDFEVQLYPAGVVNRKPYNGDLSLSKDAWVSAVSSVISIQDDALLTIGHTYNEETKALKIDVSTTFTEVESDAYNVCVYITGDTISPQKNSDPELGPSPLWEDYYHHGIFIQAPSGTYGKALNDGVKPNPDEPYKLSFETTLKEGWKAEQCHIVAFVSKTDTREVVQAEEVDIIQE